MIRRRFGDQWMLITQSDHAALSGQLARHVGGASFESLSPQTILGCQIHDAGWPVHDDLPTLNAEGLPLDVFESPRRMTLPIWAKSAELAVEADVYAGLLVSLHSLCLSAMPETTQPPRRFESSQMKERFENNKFQHRQIELQENLRRRLGMRTDVPLTLGLAEPGVDPREDQLLFDFRWLQALDQISLGICCTQAPFSHATVHSRRSQRSISLRLIRHADDLQVHPWPFGEAELSCAIMGRLVRGGGWESDAAFQDAYRVAPIERIEVRMSKG